MTDALSKIVAEYDAAVSRERSRWGEESAASVAAKGINPALLVKDHRTIHALADRGAVTMTTEIREFSNVPRKGSWGHGLGGTKTRRYTQFMVVPTTEGRAALEFATRQT